MHLDVGLRSAQDLLLEAVDGKLAIAADLRLGGTAAAPMVSGKITAASGGQVFMGGRTYDVESAALDFTPGARPHPSRLARPAPRHTVRGERGGGRARPALPAPRARGARRCRTATSSRS